MEKVKAHLLISGGKIYCGRNLPVDYNFIAVADNKILGLGYHGQEGDYIGEGTRIILLEEHQMVIPGIHDNHIHLIQAGMLDKYADLTEAGSQDEAAKIAADFAQTIPDEKWVMGFGWSRMGWKDKDLPVKGTLDRYLPHRPVFLLDSELHGAWVNSKALALCKITSETENPPYGMIARDHQGNPTGFLNETALCLVGKYALDFDNKLVEDLINRYMDNALKWGITSVSDMTPYLGLNLAYETVYFNMNRLGKLKIRINAARNLFEDMSHVLDIKKKAEDSGTGMYRVPYMKQFLDGVITNCTALMLEEYSHCPGNKGGALLDLKQVNEAVTQAQKNNLSVRLHACGDGAVRAALDAYAGASQVLGKASVRHQIEHIESIDPTDIARFKALEVIASVQPEHIISGIPTFADNCYPALLGPDRQRYTWAFRSLLDQGAVLAGGSDAPVVEGNPFYGMYCGMVRKHPDGSPAGGWNSPEKLKIEELLHAYTYGGAYAEGREAELGTLEPGKLADISILDRNLFTISDEEVKETEVLFTIVDGKVMYEGGQ